MIFKFFPKFMFWIMLLFDEVRFRDAELSRICKSDYRIRIHRAHESSGWGKAGWKGLILQFSGRDAITDGSSRSIKWNIFRFHDKSDKEI